MKQISNKEYEAYQKYQTDKLHGRIPSAGEWLMRMPMKGGV